METEQRRELMQTGETWLSNQLPTACLERPAYEDAVTPMHLLRVEQWLDEGAMNSYLSSERFRALIGAIKVLGEWVDLRIAETTLIGGG